MKRLLLGALVLSVASSAVSEEEFKRDLRYAKEVEERLEEIDAHVRRGEVNEKLLGELNSYGYPLHRLKEKYLREEGRREQEFYRRLNRLYDKVLYVKRGAFPEVLRREIEGLKVPVCKVVTEGKRREALVIGIENPGDEEAVLKIMTQTQLQNAHLLGIESVNFEKCR